MVKFSRLCLVYLFLFSSFAKANWVYVEPTHFNFQELRIKEISDYLLNNPDTRWKHKESFLKALPQIQKVLIVRDFLIPIVSSYTNTQINLTGSRNDETELEKLKNIIHTREDYKSIVSEYNVHFKLGKNQFLVDGVPTTRLAINTGDTIIFNGEALGSRSYSVAEITQIWLHEIFHLDQKIPIQIHDQWIAKVTQWISERTQVLDLNNNSKITLFSMPTTEEKEVRPGDSPLSKNQYHNSTFEEQFKDKLKSQFLVLQESPKETKLLDNIYDGLRTYSNILNNQFPDWEYLNLISWPQIKFIEMKKKYSGNIVFKITQNNQFLLKDYQNNSFAAVERFTTGTYSQFPTTPNDIFSLEYNPITSSTIIQRTYSKPLPESDFEINRIKDTKENRYLSIRLNIPDPTKTLKTSISTHLLLKNPDTSTVTSIPLTKYRIIGPNEVILHFQVPQLNFEISQIILPIINTEGLYSELAIRPSKPQYLFGTNIMQKSDFELASFEIKEKELEKDKVAAELKLKSKKSISHVTLELEQFVRAVHHDWNNTSGSYNPLSFSPETSHAKQTTLGELGVGRKYFFAKEKLNIKNELNHTRIRIFIPEDLVEKIEKGPRFDYARKISWAYNVHLKGNRKAKTIYDTRYRKITNAWIHFDDGSQEKIDTTKLPPNFSFVSKEEKNNALQEAKRHFSQSLGIYDDTADIKKLECRGLFNP